MAFVQIKMDFYTASSTPVMHTAEKTGLGPKTAMHAQKGIKADRLKNQLFTCELLALHVQKLINRHGHQPELVI